MTDATRLGQYVRRMAATSSTRRVRRIETARQERDQATRIELDARFHDHVEAIALRVEADRL
jgi:GAF domain-containing protein